MSRIVVSDRIFVAGHAGMVGSAVMRHLREEGFHHLITRRRSELDLTRQEAVERFFSEERPEVVIHAAALVGGIEANRIRPAEFLQQNLLMAANIIDAAWKHGTRRLLYLGSSCIYPRMAPQPMPEACLLQSALEPTNEAYALAKIVGLKMCQHFRSQYGVVFHSAMPTNLYGPGDNYHPSESHVLPALIRRFHEAKINRNPFVTLWGTGSPRREFLHTDDLATAVLHLLRMDVPPDWVNVGSGTDTSIRELAELVRTIVGAQTELQFDPSKPDGTPRKLLDSTLLRATGWEPRISLPEGIARTYRDFLQALESGALRQ